MTEQDGTQNSGPDVFTMLVGPVALDQAEKALAKVIMSHVARVAVTKVTHSVKTVGIVQTEGRAMLVELAQHVYGITHEQAIVVIEDAIMHARHTLRKAA